MYFLPRKSHRQSGGDQETLEGRQGVQPTPWQCTKCRLPRKSHRQSGGDQGTPEGRQGVQPTPWQCTKCRACHAKATGRAAETKGHRRDAKAYIRPLGSAPSATPATHSGGDQGTPEGGQGVHPTPWQCTKCHA